MATPHVIGHSEVVDRFSLVRGGLTDHIQAWLRLVVLNPKHVWDRILIAWVITWLPLVLLSAMDGSLAGRKVTIPFLLDYATNIRFLITLPLLLFAQVIIDRHTKESVKHFVDSDLISHDHLPAYERVIERSIRLRDSRIATTLLLIVAFLPSVLLRGFGVTDGATTTWSRATLASGPALHSAAGLYATIVSLPLYRLLLFRWLWLMIVWAVFLKRATQLPLRCVPSHPDGAGGLGFLGHTQLFFGYVLFAGSCVVAGGFANMIFYAGSSIDKLKLDIITFCVLSVLFALMPLLAVTPRLIELKQQGLYDYHRLGVDYTWQFDRKWIHPEHPNNEKLLGTSDIQSLADLGNSVAVVRKMSVILADRDILIGLTIPTVLPMLVLLATSVPLDKLLHAMMRLLG